MQGLQGPNEYASIGACGVDLDQLQGVNVQHLAPFPCRALREAVLRQASEAGKVVDDSKYKGMNNYIDYRAGFRCVPPSC